MKNILYVFLVLSSFQSFGMNDEEIRFKGQKIIKMNFIKTEYSVSYYAALEDNSVINATLILTGPTKNSFSCTRNRHEVQRNHKFRINEDPEELPTSTFGVLKNLYKEFKEK